jgi:hypothetical protein
VLTRSPDKLFQFDSFLRKGQRIYDDRPLVGQDHTSSHLNVQIAGENKNVLGYPFFPHLLSLLMP